MSPRLTRSVILVVFVAGIAGMIVGSIADNNGLALTFGLLSAVAALCLMVATAVGAASVDRTPPGFDPETGEELERRIDALVSAGADEESVRDLVRWSVRLGSSGPRR